LEYKPKINFGFDLKIKLYLAGREDSNPRYVYSHPQAIEQAKSYLDKLNLKIIPVSSTSEAAKKAREDKNALALTNIKASERYNLKIMQQVPINNNYTRFLVISKEKLPLDLELNRFVMIFQLENKPGSLYNFLEYFAKNNINLTKIESIPKKDGSWEYLFILEGESDKKSIDVKELNKKGKVLYLEDYCLISSGI